MVKKCPYCFEDVEERTPKCPHCAQHMLDDVVEVDYHGVEKKNCFFCGKKVKKEASICKYCHKWLDEVRRRAEDIKDIEGYD